MNVIELRDRLNILIDEGKGDYTVINEHEGLNVLSNIDVGIVSFGTYDHMGFYTELSTECKDEDTDLHKQCAGELKRNKLYNAIDIY